MVWCYPHNNIFEILDIADEVIQDRRELEKERASHENLNKLENQYIKMVDNNF